MCKKNVKKNIYYANICKYVREKNITRLRCKIVLKIAVKQTKGNDESYFYLYLFEVLVHRSF